MTSTCGLADCSAAMYDLRVAVGASVTVPWDFSQDLGILHLTLGSWDRNLKIGKILGFFDISGFLAF